MSEKSVLERCWVAVDVTLLMVVAALLAYAAFDFERTAADSRERASVAEPGLTHRETKAGVSTRFSRVSSVTAGMPVSLSRNRVSSIARTMAENGWEGLPSSLAADMREQNGFYDISFALPPQTDPSSVKVSTSGNVLTLFVNASGSPAPTYVKQFYIPCGAERAGTVETSVSNDIVRVRIRQKVG